MMKSSSNWNTAAAVVMIMNTVKNMMIAVAIITIIITANAVKVITTMIASAKKKTESSQLKRGCLGIPEFLFLSVFSHDSFDKIVGNLFVVFE